MIDRFRSREERLSRGLSRSVVVAGKFRMTRKTGNNGIAISVKVRKLHSVMACAPIVTRNRELNSEESDHD
jgi:hypothetical protein